MTTSSTGSARAGTGGADQKQWMTRPQRAGGAPFEAALREFLHL